MSAPTVLYCSRDLSRVLGVTPQAISNWRKRGTGPTLPDALYVTRGGAPLYTRDQVETLIADRAAAAREVLS